ncbi:MAG TPA: non-homologous end-joining DNA ligase [Dehalococcoidia bacterium]|nr:non-homologous end-joining DNA ligase [Dehalococcoidia bacterium]
MPETLRPMLSTEAKEPFDSPDYLFELLWGGLRCAAHVRDGAVRLRGRNSHDLTPLFPELAGIAERVRGREAILDGEIVAIDGEGYPSFDLLRPRLQAGADGGRAAGGAGIPPELAIKRLAGQLSYQAFDILWLDGRALLDRPLWQRKNRLAEVIAPSAEFAAVDFVDDEGIAFFEAVVQRRLEGTVAKQKNSTYTPGRRSKSWLEIRALQSGDFVVGGYTFGGAHRKGEPFSQLLLGGYADGRFEYVGAVSGGLTDAEARQLVARMEPLVIDESPFFDTPSIARLTYWTRPEIVCHVRFSEWSRDGQLRFPIFSALRPDIDATDCVVD